MLVTLILVLVSGTANEYNYHCLPGYIIYYTTDATRRHTDWLIDVIDGNRLSATIRDLHADSTYYFKVASRNKAGHGPLSPTVIFHTPHG